MRVVGFDPSSHTGWALFEDKRLVDFNVINVKIPSLNFKPDPSKSPEYPFNLLKSSKEMADAMYAIIETYKPIHLVVIENTVKGRNRTIQRWLEWMHKDFLELLIKNNYKFLYLDPSEWRAKLGLRLSKEQKKHNREVSSGKSKKRINKKHLSIDYANSRYNLKLKVKNNNEADALNLVTAYLEG
jgi:hypothetical protein